MAAKVFLNYQLTLSLMAYNRKLLSLFLNEVDLISSYSIVNLI